MISKEISRTGVPVLKKNGRFLASSIDPLREASSWAERACVDVARAETLIVLGMGSGYHVAALLERGVSCLVIEPDTALVKAAQEIFPSLAEAGARVRIVSEADWVRLVEVVEFREAVCGAYRVVPHGASLQLEPAYFEAVARLLRSRDKLSFLLMLKTRPELAAQLEPEALKNLGNDPHENEAISIKTLARLFGPQSAGSRERRLWRILEELVV